MLGIARILRSHKRTALFRPRVLIALSLSLVALFAVSRGAQGEQKPPLTVRASIETTRLMSGRPRAIHLVDGQLRPFGQQSVFVSPDKRRYVVMLVRGDLEKNGVAVEIRAGRLDSLEATAQLDTVARFFTSGLGSSNGEGSSELMQPGANPPIWMADSQTVVFLWEDASKVRQVVSVDVVSGKTKFLTHHPTDVLGFNLDRHSSLIYSARVDHSPMESQRLLRDGFVVTNPDVFSLLNGDADGFGLGDRMESFERFVITQDNPIPRKLVMDGSTITRTSLAWALESQFSPDGRYAVVEATPTHVSREWAKYTHPYFKSLINAVKPGSRQSHRQVLQLYVVDLATAQGRSLWPVPVVPPIESDVKIAWAPNGHSLLVGPTFLPTSAAVPDGLAGKAVAEVDVASGMAYPVPVPRAVTTAGIVSMRWLSAREIAIDDSKGKTLYFKRTSRQWRHVEPDTVVVESTPPIRIELRQGLNTPPKLIAVRSGTARERLVLDLNPRLTEAFNLARVELINWLDSAGRTWTGLLYYPGQFKPGQKYPLVIQTHGHALPTEFSLYGPGGWQPGLGPGISVYAAQAIASRNIAVLQMQDKYVEGESNGPGEPRLYMDAFEAAIEHLTEMQIVDPTRIGLMGHSRMGWKVEFALSHSDFPYAAAIASDNLDAGYFQAGSMSWMAGYGEEPNGAPPFGSGLQVWLKNSPAFNVERIHTPLQLISSTSTGGLTSLLAHGWEMFSRLRYLGKPVEWYVIPDIEHGSHSIQNPKQCLAAQERAVDWWDFWLNGHEESDEGKAMQYQSWRSLRELQRETLLEMTR